MLMRTSFKDSGGWSLRWRTVAATIAFLLLSAQIGLACHGASHLHEADEPAGCGLCLVGSHFVAEPEAVQEIETDCQVVILAPADASALPESILQTSIARGPPLASV
jgi:hypothetical protein